MSEISTIAQADMRLLQAVFRAARECFGDSGDLERAVDEFDLRASFQIPPA
jgi:hypothetical protein